MVKLKNKFLVLALTLVMIFGVFAGLSFNKKLNAVYASGGTISTVADVLNTVNDNFPTTKETGWVSSDSNNVAYIYNANNTLRFEKVNDSTTFYSLSLNSDVEFVSGNYSCHRTDYDCTCTFVMKDNKLSSIVFSSSFKPEVEGTYSAPVTIANILPENFPTSHTDGWANENGITVAYVYNEKIYFHEKNNPSAHINFSTGLSLTPNGENYTVTDNGRTITFIMESNVLTKITVSIVGTDHYGGDYISPAPKVNDTFTADGIKYVVTSVGETNTVKVGDNTSFEGTDVTIPTTVDYNGVTFSVTIIDEEAFKGKSNITAVSIPNSVVTIGRSSFDSTSISEITIPANVTTINDFAFSQCRELKTLNMLANEVPALEGNSCFLDCNCLEKIYVPASSLEAYKQASGWSAYESKIIAMHTHNEGTESITFVAWSGGNDHNSMPKTAGNYVLTSDIDLVTSWNVPEGITNLCLNGHVIKHVSDQETNVINVGTGSTLNLYDCDTRTEHYFSTNSSNWILQTERKSNSKVVTGGVITGGNNSVTDGGGIYVEGVFNMYGGSIIGNIANYGDIVGGGVCVETDGIFNMYGGTISGNYGYIGAAVAVRGEFYATNSSFTGHDTANKGGAIYIDSTATIENCLITNNIATWGGAIFINSGTFTAKNCQIIENEARYGGGAVEIENEGCIFILDGGAITGNVIANVNGGLHKGAGIHFNKGSFIIKGEVNITNNKCADVDSNIYLRKNEVEFNVSEMSKKSKIGIFAHGAEDATETVINITDGEDDTEFLACFNVDNIPVQGSFAYTLKIDGNKQITLNKLTIADILPNGFPTTEASAWVNEKGGKAYLFNGDTLKYGTSEVEISNVVTLNDENYKYGAIILVVDSNNTLIEIVIKGMGDPTSINYGTYIAPVTITKPTANTTNFVYTGNPQTYTLATNDAYIISDNTTQTEVGTYTITVSLINKFQYKWADGTTDDLTYKFVINKKVEDVVVKENGVEIDKSQAKVVIIEAENGIDPDAVFVIKTIPNTNIESINNTENVLRENNKLEKQEVVAVYDAKLLVNNVEVQPNGIIKIKMLVPEEVKGNNFKLYHIHNGTEVIEVDYTAVDENGYITFETDKLSEFAFATNIKGAGLSAGAIVGIVLGSLIILAIIAYVLGYFFLYRTGKLDDKKIKAIYKILPRGENNLKEEKQTTTKKTPKNK